MDYSEWTKLPIERKHALTRDVAAMSNKAEELTPVIVSVERVGKSEANPARDRQRFDTLREASNALLKTPQR